MNKNQSYNVKNRSMGMVVYTIPEEGIRREFQPGETKKIKYGELEKLSYIPGGLTLMNDYLMITNDEVIEELGIHTEPEYFITEGQIIELMKNGSYDAWLDCLDFAPAGVIDLIKKLSVTVPLNDIPKRDALKIKTGFDVDAAIRNAKEEVLDVDDVNAAPAKTNRRTTTNYKIVSKE